MQLIHHTGEEVPIDGVRYIFQMASGTEAPAEFAFFLPDHIVLCMAEVCTQTMHNTSQPQLEALAGGKHSLQQLEKADPISTGNREVLGIWLDLHDSFDLWFDIVTP